MTGPALALALHAARGLLGADRQPDAMTRAELVALTAAYSKVVAALVDALDGPDDPAAGDADIIPIRKP